LDADREIEEVALKILERRGQAEEVALKILERRGWKIDGEGKELRR
jgi:hypothetical protein